jgi:hypothetical protein
MAASDGGGEDPRLSQTADLQVLGAMAHMAEHADAHTLPSTQVPCTHAD